MAIATVIKYNGGPGTIAWKFPSEELSTWTQLIVNESQEAVLVKDGIILDVFGPGRYTLDTANIPVLNQIIQLPFGGHSPFWAEVWYINKAFNLSVKWGTPSPVQLQDPKFGIFVPVRANGIFDIQVYDSWQFLVKLIGTLRSFDTESIRNYFRGLIVAETKDAISTYLVREQTSILEINTYIDKISAYMGERIQPALEEYGVDLIGFYVNEISIPEDDLSVKQLKDALSKRAEMDIGGLGTENKREAIIKGGATCSNCGAKLHGTGKFCHNCGRKLNLCPDCGRDIPNGAPECPSCGYRPGASCPNCGETAPLEAKFCPHCGIRLSVQCPKCGTTYGGSPKFCRECGEKL